MLDYKLTTHENSPCILLSASQVPLNIIIIHVGHFRYESFQAMDCTGNKNKKNSLKP